MRFWLEKGVDGFRMDVIPFLSKDSTFSDFPSDRKNDLTYYANGPRIHAFLKEMYREVMSHYDCMTVGEGFGVSTAQANLYVGKNRRELNMIYHFDHAVPREEHRFLDPAPEFTLLQLKNIYQKWDKTLGNNGWQNTYWGNHDNPRALSRFGNTEKFHVESAKMLATLLILLRGTPSIYQGDEIGMTNCMFENIEEFDDIQVKNAYKTLIVDKKGSEKKFIETCNIIARDHARTPMQWDNTSNAHFTEGGKTWLKVNPNFTTINARQAEQNPNSIYHFYKMLIALRKKHEALVYGKYKDLTPDDAHIWAFSRTFNRQKIIIVCNFTGDTRNIVHLKLPKSKQVLLSNYKNRLLLGSELAPYEAMVYC
jgi:oligo-1,6-glucosidase